MHIKESLSVMELIIHQRGIAKITDMNKLEFVNSKDQLKIHNVA
jgi:hypothetical protein